MPSLKRLGIVGWRGMVGSVLLRRMEAEADFLPWETTLFSTSQSGEPSPHHTITEEQLKDAYDLNMLADMDAIISCQGSDYTERVHRPLRKLGWRGYWIDAAAKLRMEKESTLVLDPVNLEVIKKALQDERKDFVGPNCTVSLMLMSMGRLLKENLVEFVNAATYQAISGAGAGAMKEFFDQMQIYVERAKEAAHYMSADESLDELNQQKALPNEVIGQTLVGNVLPWIDAGMDGGQTKEEWKGSVETNKILGLESPVAVDGTCVRVGVMGCHSQALTIKLRQELSLESILDLLRTNTPWTKVLPNTKEASLKSLVPSAARNSLYVRVGRVRKLSLGPRFLGLFSVGDQLLWGAAEPLRRTLNLIRQHHL